MHRVLAEARPAVGSFSSTEAYPAESMNCSQRRPSACLSKVQAVLSTGAGQRAERLAFLVLPGSFNPVHSQHLRALEAARDRISNLDWHVIGGFLAPSDDDYVRQKLGDDAWSLERRFELCCLATDDSPWVDVAPWGEYSSYRVTTRLRQTIELDCSKELRGRSAVGIEVMGSDTAIRILRRLLSEWDLSKGNAAQPWYQERLVCSLVRPGTSAIAEYGQLETVIRPRVDAIGVKLIVAGGDSANPLLEVSSREIRKAIAMQRWDQLRHKGWLAPRVLDRLQAGYA
jgi:hypothetical protein